VAAAAATAAGGVVAALELRGSTSQVTATGGIEGVEGCRQMGGGGCVCVIWWDWCKHNSRRQIKHFNMPAHTLIVCVCGGSNRTSESHRAENQ